MFPLGLLLETCKLEFTLHQSFQMEAKFAIHEDMLDSMQTC